MRIETPHKLFCRNHALHLFPNGMKWSSDADSDPSILKDHWNTAHTGKNLFKTMIYWYPRLARADLRRRLGLSVADHNGRHGHLYATLTKGAYQLGAANFPRQTVSLLLKFCRIEPLAAVESDCQAVANVVWHGRCLLVSLLNCGAPGEVPTPDPLLRRGRVSQTNS
jgi:hypothetical protein